MAPGTVLRRNGQKRLLFRIAHVIGMELGAVVVPFVTAEAVRGNAAVLASVSTTMAFATVGQGMHAGQG